MTPGDSSPWRLQNSQGNTPLHVAVIRAELEFATKLVERDPQLTGFVNNSKESPLHLAIRYRVGRVRATTVEQTRITEEYVRRSKLEGCVYHNNERLHQHDWRGSSPSGSQNICSCIDGSRRITQWHSFSTRWNSNSIEKGSVFLVFLCSDVGAVCLSMVVLLCLVWIMCMGNQGESVVLLDVTLFLLQASFYATLLAFMTGVYVTTCSFAKWLAVFTCVLTSSLMLLMHKRFIRYVIPSFIRIFVMYQRGDILLGENLYLVLCGVSKRTMIRVRQLGRNQSNEGEQRNSANR